MVAAAEAGEAVVVVDEVAVVLEAEEAADLVAGLAAAGCRDHRRRLADHRRLADQRRGRAAAAFRVPPAALRSPRAASVVQVAHVPVVWAARDRSRGHRRGSRRDRGQARLTSRAGGPVVRDRD
jgi:hypothetical protein